MINGKCSPQKLKYARDRYHQLKTNNLCVDCGNPAITNETHCITCKNTKKAGQKRLYDQRKSNHLCTVCGIPVTEGIRCPLHKEKHALQKKRHQSPSSSRHVVSPNCLICGQPSVRWNRCRYHINEYQRNRKLTKKAEGICIDCTEPATHNYRCEKHYAIRLSLKKITRDRKKADHICINCKNPATHGFLCNTHHRLNLLYDKLRRLQKKVEQNEQTEYHLQQIRLKKALQILKRLEKQNHLLRQKIETKKHRARVCLVCQQKAEHYHYVAMTSQDYYCHECFQFMIGYNNMTGITTKEQRHIMRYFFKKRI